MDPETRVLVVDDEPGIRTLLTEILSERFLVETADSAGAAMDCIEQNTPDVVVSDIKMPGEDGLSLLAKIKKAYPKIVVILLTGHGDKGIIVSGLRNGAFDYLDKPCDEEDLITAVEKAESACFLNRYLEEMNIQSTQAGAFEAVADGTCVAVNNPLASVNMALTLVKELVVGDAVDRKEIIRLVDNAIDNTMRIGRIVSRINHQLSPDRLDAKSEVVPVESILKGVCQIHRETFASEGIDFVFPTVSQSLKIQCHPAKMVEAIGHILNNAREWVIENDSKWIRVDVSDSERWVDIHIANSGPEIPKDIQDKIFQPFFTSNPYGKNRKLGIGLSTAMVIVSNHGGILKVCSKKPLTCFEIRLPKATT